MIFDSLRPDLLLLLVVLLVGAVRARRTDKVAPIEGVRSYVAASALIYLGGWLAISYLKWPVPPVVVVAGLLAYLGTSLLVALEKYGAQILAKPYALLKAVLPAGIAKLLPDDETPTT